MHALVTHDIGNMVGYAFAAQYRNRVICFVAIDAPLPGGPWDEILKNPLACNIAGLGFLVVAAGRFGGEPYAARPNDSTANAGLTAEFGLS